MKVVFENILNFLIDINTALIYISNIDYILNTSLKPTYIFYIFIYSFIYYIHKKNISREKKTKSYFYIYKQNVLVFKIGV